MSHFVDTNVLLWLLKRNDPNYNIIRLDLHYTSSLSSS